MDSKITRDMSKFIYGIAIILMIYHHLFCIPERIHYEYFSVLDYCFPFISEPLTLERRLAFFGKICVALFAFISGYGLAKSIKQDANNKPIKFVLESYLNMFKRYLKFILKTFLVIFLVIIPFKIINSETITFKEIVLNGFGIKSTLVGEWWYVVFYVSILSLFPLINIIFSKNFGNIYIEIIFKILSLTILILVNIFTSIDYIYFIIVVEGYLVARFSVIERIDRYLSGKFRIVFSIIILCLTIALRIIFALDAAYSFIDMFIIFPFIYSICELFNSNLLVSKIVMYLGNHSTFIWLTHTIFAYQYLSYFLTLSHISTVIFIETTIISLVGSIILKFIEKYALVLIGKIKQLIIKRLKKDCANNVLNE